MTDADSPQKCPRCGQHLPPGQEGLCIHCIRLEKKLALPPPPGQGPRPKTKPIVVVLVILVCLIGIPSCLLGGCVLLLTGGEPDGLMLGIGGIVVFLVLLGLLIKLARS